MSADKVNRLGPKHINYIRTIVCTVQYGILHGKTREPALTLGTYCTNNGSLSGLGEH